MELLNKYGKGNSTKEEGQFLLSYYELFDSEPDGLALLSMEKREELKNHINNNIWENISFHEEEQQGNAIRSKRKSWIRGITAAAAAVFIIISTGMYFLNQSPSKARSLITRSDQIKEHRLIHLPDGSTVIIGAGSKLNYPSSFDGLSKREVYLEGQAYFDVKHNSVKPFIIHTGKIQTTVLGTAFNIKAWPDETEITVTVIRGKVKVQDENKTLGIITPNQQISYNKKKADVVRKVVNADEYLAWKEQDLFLDNVTVAEALELLEDRYNVSISISDEQIQTNRFTTTFQKGASLEHVLKSICEFNGTDYEYDKQKASVIINTK